MCKRVRSRCYSLNDTDRSQTPYLQPLPVHLTFRHSSSYNSSRLSFPTEQDVEHELKSDEFSAEHIKLKLALGQKD